MENGKQRAEDILRLHSDQLKALALALLEKETLDVKEVYELLGIPREEEKFSPIDLTA